MDSSIIDKTEVFYVHREKENIFVQETNWNESADVCWHLLFSATCGHNEDIYKHSHVDSMEQMHIVSVSAARPDLRPPGSLKGKLS